MALTRSEKILLCSVFAAGAAVGGQHWALELRYPVEDAQKVLVEAGYQNVAGGQRKDYLCNNQPARLFYHQPQNGQAEPVVVCYGASGPAVRPG